MGEVTSFGPAKRRGEWDGEGEEGRGHRKGPWGRVRSRSMPAGQGRVQTSRHFTEWSDQEKDVEVHEFSNCSEFTGPRLFSNVQPVTFKRLF